MNGHETVSFARKEEVRYIHNVCLIIDCFFLVAVLQYWGILFSYIFIQSNFINKEEFDPNTKLTMLRFRL